MSKLRHYTHVNTHTTYTNMYMSTVSVNDSNNTVHGKSLHCPGNTHQPQ